MRHHRRHTPADRDRTATRHSQLMAAGVSQAASSAVMEGRALAALADAAAEPLSEAREREPAAGSCAEA
jgi:hypothetical protein